MSESGKRQLVVIRRSPYGSSLARAAVDLVLAAAAFEQAVSVLFLGEGVLQLLPEQDSTVIDRKNLARLIDSMPLYDIETLYVDAAALARFAIVPRDLPPAVRPVEGEAIRQLLASHHHLLGF